MAKFENGTRVETIDSGEFGYVQSLESLRTGKRGRPRSIAIVKLDSGLIAEFSLSQLTAVKGAIAA